LDKFWKGTELLVGTENWDFCQVLIHHLVAPYLPLGNESVQAQFCEVKWWWNKKE